MGARHAALLAILLILAFLPFGNAYTVNQSREQLLARYYADVEPKIPPSARMLIGDERINAYIGNQTFGAVVQRGSLTAFDYSPLDNPTITVRVSDYAADSISKGQMGIMDAIDNGGITIQTSSFLSAIKVAMMERIYAASGYDRKIAQGSGSQESEYVYIQRTSVAGAFTFW